MSTGPVRRALAPGTNLLLRTGTRHSAGLEPGPGQDVFLLVALEMFRRPASWRRRAGDRVSSLLPNHWVLLRSPITVDGSVVSFGPWSWGENRRATLRRSVFRPVLRRGVARGRPGKRPCRCPDAGLMLPYT